MLVKLFRRPATRVPDVRAGQVARDGVRMAMMVRVFLTHDPTGAGTALFYGLGSAVIEGRLSLGTLTAMVALLAPRLYGPPHAAEQPAESA